MSYRRGLPGQSAGSSGRRAGFYVLAVLAVLAIILGLFAIPNVSQNKASATRWGCVYGGGALDTPGLKMTVAPGTRGGWTVWDNWREVPSDVRDYIIDADDKARDPNAVPIVLPVRARDIQVGDETVESAGVTYILLELQAKFLFNENACLWDQKYGRGTDNLNFDAPQGEVSGWTTWLKNNMYKRIQEAARPVVKDFDWLQLSTNQEVTFGETTDEVFDILATEIAATLEAELAASLGSDFFCGPSYAFDGDMDGELENCPPIEISITELTPQNPELIANYEAIVANAEAQQRIESDRDRSITESDSQADIAVAQAENTQRAELAEQERRREVETASAETDLAVAQAQASVAQQEAQNAELVAQGEAAYCVALAEVGVDCALRTAAENGNYPQVIVGGDAASSILIDPSAMTAEEPAP